MRKIQEAYLRWLVTGLNEFDNLLYEVSNETHPSSTEWQYHVIRYVKRIESSLPKQHPIGMTYQNRRGKNQTLLESPADWISPNSEGGFRDDPPDLQGAKVVLSDTDHLWGIGGDAIWVWKTFARGLNPIFMDTYDGKVLGKVRPQDDGPRRAMGQVLALSRRINLARSTPSKELVLHRLLPGRAGRFVCRVCSGGWFFRRGPDRDRRLAERRMAASHKRKKLYCGNSCRRCPPQVHRAGRRTGRSAAPKRLPFLRTPHMFPMNRILRDLLIPSVVLLALASPTSVHAQKKRVSQTDDVAPAADRGPTRFTTQDPPSDLIPPYPPSDFIESLTVDAHRVSIGDGDNWANTWGDDDRMYSFFTDGRGFDRKKRVSCAPVIIKGHPPQISGRDLVSPTGTIPDPSGKNSRKVCGLLMVDGVLYAWVRNLNLPDAPKGTGAGMMVSTDRGRTWEWVDWNWPELGYPVWMNAGRNYQAAPDDYAYYLSPDGPSAYADYPHLVLGRVPVASIRDQAAHEFFAGLASPGVPRGAASNHANRCSPIPTDVSGRTSFIIPG